MADGSKPADGWYFVKHNNSQREGPATLAKLKAMVSDGWLISNDLVWQFGMADWELAGKVPELFGNQFSQKLRRACEPIGSHAKGPSATSIKPPAIPVKHPGQALSRRSKKGDPFVVTWHDLSARHVWIAYGGFLAAIGITCTAIVQSRLPLAIAIGGSCIAVAGLYVEIGVIFRWLIQRHRQS